MTLFKVTQAIQTAEGLLNPDTVYDSANFTTGLYNGLIAAGVAITSFDVDDAAVVAQVTANSNQIGIVSDSTGVSLGAIISPEADDSGRFQRAITAIKTKSQYPVLKLPAGKFTVKNISHSEGVLYVGAGSGQTEIVHADGYAEPLITVTGGTTGTPMAASAFYGFVGLKLTAGNQTTDLIWYDGQIDNNVKFDDLQLIGGASANQVCNGINVRDYLNFHIGKIRWDRIGGWGIKVRDAQYFSHSVLSIDDFTYDNEARNGESTKGQGILYLNTSSLPVEKGVVSFKDGRIEINTPLTASKPSRALFRFEQNTTRTSTNGSQVILDLENITIDVDTAALDMKVASTNGSNDVAVSCRNVTVYGANDFYNNDNMDSKYAINSHTQARVSIQSVPWVHAYSIPERIVQNKLYGMNLTSHKTDSDLTSGFYNQGDISYRVTPDNVSGKLGRAFAFKAVQTNAGRSSGTATTIFNGSITSGTNQLTVDSLTNTRAVPGQSIDIPGAGNSGATLTTMITSIDYTNKIVTVSTNASATVSSVAVTTSVAKLMVVDMVFYATTMPTSGTYQIGDYVKNTSTVIQGTTGSKYVTKGWIRTTNGSNHVLNTDWVEDKVVTGT